MWDEGQTSALQASPLGRGEQKLDWVMMCQAGERPWCWRQEGGVRQLVRRRLGRPAGQFQ
jgi:hypothetical protein